MQRRNISVYHATEYFVVRLREVSAEDRRQAVGFAEHCLNRSYAYLSALSVAFSLFIGTGLVFGVAGQLICSGLVARALERTGEVFEDEPGHVTPAALAKHFKVTVPARKEKGKVPRRSQGVIHRSGLRLH